MCSYILTHFIVIVQYSVFVADRVHDFYSIQFLWKATQIQKVFKGYCHVLNSIHTFWHLSTQQRKELPNGRQVHSFSTWQAVKYRKREWKSWAEHDRKWAQTKGSLYIIGLQGQKQRRLVVILMSQNTNLPDFAIHSTLQSKVTGHSAHII